MAVAGLSLPEECARLRQEPQLWTPATCSQLLDEADVIGFTDPRGGLVVAEETVRMVDRLPGPYERGADKLLLKGRGFRVLGSRFRAVAELDKAGQCFMIAGGLMRGAPVLEIADLLRRRVYLRIAQRRLGAAARLARQGLMLVEQDGDEHEIGLMLLAQAEVKWVQGDLQVAKQGFQVALETVDPKRWFIAHCQAVHNLAVMLVKGAGNDDEIKVALEQIRRTEALGFGPDTLPGLSLRWVKALLLEKMAEEETAEDVFRAAALGLEALGAPYEVALIKLDLAALLCRQGRLEDLIEIAAQMFPLFKQLRANREVIAGLRLFHNAALNRQVTVDLLHQVQRIIEKAARKVD